MEARARAELQLPPAPAPPAAPVVCAAWRDEPAHPARPAARAGAADSLRRRAEHFVEWVELLRAFGVRTVLLYLSTVTFSNRTPTDLPFRIF